MAVAVSPALPVWILCHYSQVGSFRHSIVLATQARLLYLVGAIIFTALSYAAAALTYRILVSSLQYRRTLLLQFASMFINRLLPGGIGGIGTNYAYLRHERILPSRAAASVAINNTLGLLGHALLVVGLLLVVPPHLDTLHLPSISGYKLLGVVLVIGLGVVILLERSSARQRLLRSLAKFGHQLSLYRAHPARLLGALISSVSLTLVNVLSFWLCAQGVGIHLGLTAALLIFTLGIALGTVTPTPGGLGGVEAGLVAGLVAYHTSAAEALAAVLIYRLVSYWLALVIGGFSFVVAEHRGIL